MCGRKLCKTFVMTKSTDALRLGRAQSFVQNHWQLLVMTALVFAFWSSTIAFPIRILIVFLHELSHAIAAVMTGGKVLELTLSPLEGGSATTLGGNFFFIASAGYLGSLLIGLGILFLAVRTDLDRWIVAVLGAMLLGLTLWYFRTKFAFGFGVISGAVLLIAARYGGIILCDLILRIIGLTSIIYVPYDIISDTLPRSSSRSDARNIAETFGGPTMFWGGLWLVLSLLAIAAAARFGLGERSNISFKR